MASLVLGAVGTALGGPLGGFIGSTIGSFIDQALFAPKIEGPRLKDLSVTASTYGIVIPLIYGAENRVAGNIIYATPIKEKKKKKKSGKGGPTVTTYSYSVPCIAIALGEGELRAVKRIWANSKKIFDIDEATVAPDPPTSLVGMVASSANGTHAVFDVIRFYQGNGTQQIDPTIEATEGVGNAPAYRHTAYVVLKDLQLADFGNAIPNFSFEVEGFASDRVADWVADIATRAGVAPTDITVSQVDDSGRGYVIAREVTAFGAIEPLGLAYNFDLAEQAGQIRCVRRGRGIMATVPIDDMGAASGTDRNGEEPVRFETQPPMTMPREAAVSYSDPALDYQENTQRASRQLGSSQNNIARELPLVLESTEAIRLADLLLWDAWAARRGASFPLSDRWHHLRPSDVIGIVGAGRVSPFKLIRATRGANGVIDIEARAEDPEAYRSNAIGMAGTLPANPLRLPGPTRLILMDAPIVRDADDDAGFYWAASAENAGWRGASILRSSDGGVSYNEMSGVAVRAPIGDVATALPSGPADYWDRGNVLTVVMHYADEELESLSEAEALNGANAFWLGDPDGQGGEIIQFATATLVGPATYELSNLLRGRLGTDHAIGGHGANEVFVLLEPNTLGRSDYGAGDWNASRLYKPVSVLTSEADTASQSFTGTGEGKRPLSPVAVTGVRDGSNNLTIAWHRRSRLSGAGLFGGDPPLGEEVEAYEVDVIVGGSAVRTISVTAATASYSAAEQTADGITPGDPVTVDVYQMSGSRGRGHARRAVV